ncbi:general transcription factor 3C polypeptide 4 [Rhipicephalus sanguineus]|uniref:general transcription factor 3C polypeptide 4 n=1 Tax=Rhipicephalus sanguineus TaxID=34632 RepID=UPI001892E102|nr:general transcription factor 3C polypeptide 4 [Rhipicephalus sanguineus]
MNIYEPAYVANFTGAANCYSAVSWSPHNKICAITNEAVRVLGSPCSPSESGYPLQLNKATIPNPDKPFDIATTPYDSDLGDLDTDDRHELMLDITLSPDSANAVLHKTYHRALWSPMHLGGKNRCILATLTRDHRIQIWQERIEARWECLVEPSQLHYDRAQESWTSPRKRKKNEKPSTYSKCVFDLLKERSYSVAALEIVWSHLIEDDDAKSFALLMEVTRGGQLLVWKVPVLTDGQSFEVELLKEAEANIMRAGRLCWHETSKTSGILVAGSDDGSVTLRTVALCSGDEKVRLGEPLVLQESDGRPAQHAVCTRSEGGSYLVCVAKGRILYCFRVTTDADTGRAQLLHSAFTRDACVSFVTALDKCPSNERDLHMLVCTMNGEIVNVHVDTDLNFKIEKISIELPWMLQPVGLAVSPNGAYFAMLYHITTMVHESTIKEPLQLMIYNRTGVADMSKLLLSEARKDSTTTDIQLANVLDCLDRIHSYSCGKADLLEELKVYMTDVSTVGSLDKISRFGLQLFCFLKRVEGALTKSTELDQDFTWACMELLRRHILAIVSNYNEGQLTEPQKSSLRLFYNWLATTGVETQERISRLFAPEPLASAVASVAEGGLVVFEECAICGDAIPFQDLNHGTCGQDHRFGRCANSMLVCHETPMRWCTTCQQFAQRKSVWPDGEVCLYCGKWLV